MFRTSFSKAKDEERHFKHAMKRVKAILGSLRTDQHQPRNPEDSDKNSSNNNLERFIKEETLSDFGVPEVERLDSSSSEENEFDRDQNKEKKKKNEEEEKKEKRKKVISLLQWIRAL